MSGLRVFLLRAAASAAVLLLVFAAIRLFWYPGAYFAISGAPRLLGILAGVMLVAGPVLTAFVYRPGKKGLVMDLSVLAVIELAAIVAATLTLYRNQPSFAVFAVDRFEAVAMTEVDIDANDPAFLSSPSQHHPLLVYARIPDDEAARDRLLEETVLQGMADIDRRPEFWQPYTDGIADVLDAASPFSRLLDAGGRETAIAGEWLAANGGSAQSFVFLPLRGRAGDAAIILHANTGLPAATLLVDPWPPD